MGAGVGAEGAAAAEGEPLRRLAVTAAAALLLPAVLLSLQFLF